MKIAFINARISFSSVIPTGILSIATLLKVNGYQVKVFDRSADDETLFKKIKDYNPDVLGISFITTEYKKAKKIIDWSRINLKNKIIVAGGYHASALPEETLKDLKCDIIVIGEGETTMLELAKKKFNDLDKINGIAFLKDNKFFKTKPREFIKDLDALPIIDRQLIDGGFSWYLTLPGNIRGHLVERCTTVLTSRGCPGNCIFCSSRAMWSNIVRQRSVINVIKEIELLIEKYRIKGLFFLDDTFTVNKKWILEFCGALIEKKIKLVWGCSARVNTLNDEILEAMKKSGCVQLDFGVESGCDRILKIMRKGQNSVMTINAFDLLHKHKLKSLACFIIGTPTESKEEMEETFKLAKLIKPDFAIFSIMTPLPGSPLYDDAVKNNWIEKNSNFGIDWSIRHSEHPVMSSDFDADFLLKTRQRMEDYFFAANYLHYIFPLLKKPLFVFQLLFMIIKSPIKYLSFIFGKKTRRFSGFIESIYYDYKEWKAKSIKLL